MEIWQLHEGGWSLKPSAKCTDSFTFLFRSITSLTAYLVISLRSAPRMFSAGEDVECLTTWITDGFSLFAIGVWLRSISHVHLQWRLYSVTRSVAAIRTYRVIDRNRPWAVAWGYSLFKFRWRTHLICTRTGETVVFPVLHADVPDLQVLTKMSSRQWNDLTGLLTSQVLPETHSLSSGNFIPH